jgi:tRNA(adenine34) deaminase
MYEAIAEAKKAAKESEVPVGAVVVKDGKLVARAHNLTEKNQNPTHHAEILAINEAFNTLGTKNLSGCELYVTLEPCAMCIGACALCKIDKVYFGAYDTKSGACGGKCDVLREGCFDYKTEVFGGIEETECKKILTDFFESIRKGRE